MNPINNLNPEMIRHLFDAFSYKWHPDFNIIWVRSSDKTPNVFNDFNIVTYSKNTKIELFSCTTDPGNHYLLNPMNAKGTGIVKPGQYLDSHIIGYHQQKKDHEAFVQRGEITMYRDGNKDLILDYLNEDVGKSFGANWHGAKRKGETLLVGKNSAACFVWSFWEYKTKVLALAKTSQLKKFSLNLFEEHDLISKGFNPVMSKLISLRMGWAAVESMKLKLAS